MLKTIIFIVESVAFVFLLIYFVRDAPWYVYGLAGMLNGIIFSSILQD